MNEGQTCEAPRSPGIEPRWTSSAKSGVGTALLTCTRDLGLIVTGEHGFFSEEKRHAEHQIKSLASGIPAYDLVNTHAGHYRITKRIVSDPYRDVVLQRLTFEALSQTGGRYRVYALLAPHLVNAGASNTAWLGERADAVCPRAGHGTGHGLHGALAQRQCRLRRLLGRRAGRKKKPARNPGLSSFHLGAADLVIHAAHTTARHNRSSDVEDHSISPQHETLRDMARAEALPRAPQSPEHDASHGAGAGPR